MKVFMLFFSLLHFSLCIMHSMRRAHNAYNCATQNSSIFRLSSLIIESFLIHIGQLKASRRERSEFCIRCGAATMARKDLHKNVSNFILHCMLNQFSIDDVFDKDFFRLPISSREKILIVIVFKDVLTGI
jgi:hypothetical protein